MNMDIAKHWLRNHCTVTPNHSLNRTHCGMRPKARHFILGFLPHTATVRLAQTLCVSYPRPGQTQTVLCMRRCLAHALWQLWVRCTAMHVEHRKLQPFRVNHFRVQQFCVPRSTTCCRALALAGWLSFNEHLRSAGVTASSLALRITRRSTGPIAACGQRPSISFWAFSHTPQRSD